MKLLAYQGAVAIDATCSKIRDRTYNVALVISFELMKTVDSKLGGHFFGKATFYEKEAKGIDFPFPKLFAKLADTMVNKYNLDEERFMNALGKISYINYSNAKRNPLAQTRNWYIDEKQVVTRKTETSPIIGGKLALTDCSQLTDGAATVILYSKSYLKKNNYKDKQVIKRIWT